VPALKTDQTVLICPKLFKTYQNWITKETIQIDFNLKKFFRLLTDGKIQSYLKKHLKLMHHTKGKTVLKFLIVFLIT
jgi:hypothetical protein